MSISVCSLSGPGTSALHALGLAGDRSQCESLLQDLLSQPLKGGATYTEFLDASGQSIDDGLCLSWPDPPFQFVLTTHGSPLILEEVIHRCVELGAVHSADSDQIFRVPEEAVAEKVLGQALGRLTEVISPEACSFLLEQASPSGFAGVVEKWKRQAPSIDEVREVLDRGLLGRAVMKSSVVVLTGVTNAGKSTLLNVLVGEDRSIVTPEEGTTRDLVVASTQINGFPLTLVDGAGWRESPGLIEEQGLLRVKEAIRNADLVVELIPPARLEEMIVEDSQKEVSSIPESAFVFPEDVPVIRVLSRCDEFLSTPLPPNDDLAISAKTGEGLGLLEDQILQVLYGQSTVPEGGPYPFLDEHVIFLERLVSALDSGDNGQVCLQDYLEGVNRC